MSDKWGGCDMNTERLNELLVNFILWMIWSKIYWGICTALKMPFELKTSITAKSGQLNQLNIGYNLYLLHIIKILHLFLFWVSFGFENAQIL